MADNKVDGIILEIEATTEKSDGGLEKTIKYLQNMKDATKDLDVEKLNTLKNCLQQFSTIGEKLKIAGDGMKGIATSLNSLTKIDSEKLREISSAVEKIGNALGNLGSNNKINIKIDSEGIKESVKPLEKVKEDLGTVETPKVDMSGFKNVAGQVQAATSQVQQNTSATQQNQAAMNSATVSAQNMAQAQSRVGATAQSAASGQQTFNSTINQTNTNTANAKIQALIAQINKYKATISGMESGKVMFDTAQYSEAVNGLKQMQEEFNKFKESVKESPQTMEDLAKSVQSIGDAAGKCGLDKFSSLLSGIASLLPMIEVGGAAANAGFQSMAVGLQAVQSAIPIIGIILTLISAVVNAVNSAAQKIKAMISKIVASVNSFVNKVKKGLTIVINKIKEMTKEFKASIGISDDTFKGLRKKIGSAIRLFGFMLLRSAFTQFFEFIKSGFDNLVLYSREFGTEFHKSVNLLYGDLKWIGNSFMTAFEPILNYVTPALDFLIEKLVDASNALAQFFSALTGQSTYTKAIRLNEDYAQSLEDAAKAASTLTTGIDELNILNESSGSKNDGQTAPGDSFVTEEVESPYKNIAEMIKEAWANADFTELGTLLGTKLKEALESIPWDNIKRTLEKIAKSIATFLNGFLETPGLFNVIGKTIAECINSAFTFLDSFVWTFHWDSLGKAITDSVDGLVENLDWQKIRSSIKGLATGIAELINTVCEDSETWGGLGTAVSNALNTWILYVETIISELKFDNIGTSLGTALSNAITKIDIPALTSAIGTAFSGLFEAGFNFVDAFNFTGLAENISGGFNSFLNSLKWEDYITIDSEGKEHWHAGIKRAFSFVAESLGTWISETITGIDPVALGKTIAEAINTLANGIGSFADSIDFKQIGSNIATALSTAFKNIDWKNMGESINSLASGVCDLIQEVIDETDWNVALAGVGTAMAQIDWGKIFETVFLAISSKWTYEKIFKGFSWLKIGSGVVTGFLDAIDHYLDNIGEWFYEHLIVPIKNALGIKGGESEEAKEIGGNMISGLIQGISTALLPPPLGIFAKFAQIIQWVKDLFGIHSPSTVFADIGENIIQGFINGVGSLFSKCKEKIEEWASKVKEWFGGETLQEKFSEWGSGIVTAFKDKISNTYTTVKDTVTTWASKVKEWFNSSSFGSVNTEKWTAYANDIITGFKTKIGNTYTTTKDNITTWAAKVNEWYTSSSFGSINSSTWQTYANNIITGFKDKVGSTYTTTKNNITTWASNLRDWFSGSSYGSINSTTWTTYASDIISGFKNKIGLSYTETKNSITTWASNLKTWFSGSGYGNITSSQWTTYAGNIISGFKNKIGSSYTDCKNNIITWASKVKSWFTDTCSYTTFYNFASDVISGFKNGIGNLYTTCKNTITNWGSSILDWFAEKLGINSPSKEFSEMGVWSIKGFNKGIEDYGDTTKQALTSWTDSFTGMDISLGTKLKINDEAFKDVQANYGADFSNEAIVQRVQKEVSTNGALQATLNSGGGLKEAVKEALTELGIADKVSEIASDAKRQADKKEQTIVQIGNRTITDAVTSQQSANGFRFQPT